MKKISIAVFSVIVIVIFFLYKNFPFKNESKIIEKDSGEKYLVEYDPMTEDVVETLIEGKSTSQGHKIGSLEQGLHHQQNFVDSSESQDVSEFDNEQDIMSEEDDIDKRLEQVIKAREKKEEILKAKKLQDSKKDAEAKEKKKVKEKKKAKEEKKIKRKHKDPSSKTDNIVRYARSKLGKPFRRAGVTDRGYDCSGLVMSSFSRYGVALPRASFQMAKKGQVISVKNIQKGDLLFFGLHKKKSKKINHVALVTKVKDGVVYFVHSKERSGVIENTLKQGYYRKRLLKVRRYIK